MCPHFNVGLHYAVWWDPRSQEPMLQPCTVHHKQLWSWLKHKTFVLSPGNDLTLATNILIGLHI